MIENIDDLKDILNILEYNEADVHEIIWTLSKELDITGVNSTAKELIYSIRKIIDLAYETGKEVASRN